MNKKPIACLAFWALLLSGCALSPAAETVPAPEPTPTPELTAEPTPTPEPTPEPETAWPIDPALLEPWQQAYLDILLYPECDENKEFYAVAEHIPSKNPWIIDEMTTEVRSRYCFSFCDLNGDQMPELLLGCGMENTMPRTLLNILSYEEAISQVIDLDGPRTYPIMDTLWFHDTGYFSTMNGAGGLYTEFWKVEDEDPDHYWYGYERSAAFNENGELESVMEFPFESTYGEKYTLQEYYELMGKSGPNVQWQEVTPENIAALFPQPTPQTP